MSETMIFEFLDTTVDELHTTDAYSIMHDATIQKAYEMMRENHAGYLLVIDKGIDLMGIVTERDLIHKAFGGDNLLNMAVSTIMTKNPVTIGANESVAVALQEMNHRSFHHLPVVDMAGKPIGIISISDIMNFLVEEIESEDLQAA